MVKTSRPLVSIVLATYHPDPNYFVKQLNSLEALTYPELELVVVDDSASKDVFDEVRACLEKGIRRMPFRLFRNEQNLGSTKTFEAAIREARGDYIAFCDQDDIWYPGKIESLLQQMHQEEALLVYSDMEIIDATDAVTHKSVSRKNQRILPIHGENLFSFLLQRNAVTGCSMMVTKELAHMAAPYPGEWYHHDHWLALWASDKGRIAYVPEALLGYRIHSNNQVGLRLLEGIRNRDDYDNKLMASIERMEYLLGVFPSRKDNVAWHLSNLHSRYDGFQHKRFLELLGNREAYGEDCSLRWFEALFSIAPAWLGRMMLYVIRKI